MEKNKIFLFVIIGILFTSLIAVIVALLFTLNSLKSASNLNDGKQANATEENVTQEDITIFTISDPITSNLVKSKDDTKDHILRISVGLGLDNTKKDFKKLNEQLEQKNPILRDTIIRIIRNKTYNEMLGANSQDLIADEILSQLNDEFQTDTIIKVYFDEFFVN